MEKLIAKKRAVKQGAMQELLTGKRRLPGFSGEWVEKKICDYSLLVTKGTTPTSIGRKFESTGISFVKIESIVNNRIDKNLCAFIDKGTNDTLSRSILKENDILISIAGALGRVAKVEKSILPANTNQALAIIRLDETKICIEFIYWYLQSKMIIEHIAEINVQGAQANLSLENINTLPIWVPPTTTEQAAIATVLSDMDAEIDALTTKLEKIRQIKQGMMNELLTGRIRLVEQKAISDPLAKTAKFTKQKPAVEKKKQSANVHFKRSVLAAEIADRLCGEPTFGHVKMEKMIFLTENMCNVDIGSNYHRDVAGPYDNRAIRSIDSQLKKQKWFELVRGDKGYRYVPLSKRGGHKEYFTRYYSNVLPVFDKVINTFRTLDTERCEIIATLYSAWEDLANLKQNYSDEDIIHEVLNNWNKSKSRIEKERWQKALSWMRENDFSPIKEE
jgi:type I restriction enzyme S subunit